MTRFFSLTTTWKDHCMPVHAKGLLIGGLLPVVLFGVARVLAGALHIVLGGSLVARA